jgi:hypothetical protein
VKILTLHYLAVCLTVIVPTSCYGFSGADLTKTDVTFGRGYVWGIADVLVNSDRALMVHRIMYLSPLRISSRSMYDAVVSYVKENPSSSSEEVRIIVARVIHEMCGYPRKVEHPT